MPLSLRFPRPQLDQHLGSGPSDGSRDRFGDRAGERAGLLGDRDEVGSQRSELLLAVGLRLDQLHDLASHAAGALQDGAAHLLVDERPELRHEVALRVGGGGPDAGEAGVDVAGKRRAGLLEALFDEGPEGALEPSELVGDLGPEGLEVRGDVGGLLERGLQFHGALPKELDDVGPGDALDGVEPLRNGLELVEHLAEQHGDDLIRSPWPATAGTLGCFELCGSLAGLDGVHGVPDRVKEAPVLRVL
jgi:hypothetical protein